MFYTLRAAASNAFDKIDCCIRVNLVFSCHGFFTFVSCLHSVRAFAHLGYVPVLGHFCYSI